MVPFQAWSRTGLHVTGLLRLPAVTTPGEKPRALSLILGGHRTGARAARLVNPPPGHVVAAIDYPYRGPSRWRKRTDILVHGPAIFSALRTSGPALSLTAAALAEHPLLRESPVFLVGASLGVPFAVQAVAADPRFAGLALLYGFADLERMLEHALTRVEWPAPVRGGAVAVASHLVQGFEPARHLSDLDTPVLLVNDLDDHFVPRDCVEALHRAAPPGATVHLVQTGHVQPKEDELIAELTQLVSAWSDTLAIE
jgi:pimeloyl-ACP methyl ester carboxylesterase